jgi:U3 small nucleolar ribonucleoprotein component
MLKHPDPEVQFLVEMLESQRDSAVAQAAANFRMVQELQAKVNELEAQGNKSLGDQCDEEKIGGTD